MVANSLAAMTEVIMRCNMSRMCGTGCVVHTAGMTGMTYCMAGCGMIAMSATISVAASIASSAATTAAKTAASTAWHKVTG
jgi:hypothetical protein